jgi:hypothetical protein
MIRNETEYREASVRLTEERTRLAEHRSRLREGGLDDVEIKRVVDPSPACRRRSKATNGSGAANSTTSIICADSATC